MLFSVSPGTDKILRMGIKKDGEEDGDKGVVLFGCDCDFDEYDTCY